MALDASLALARMLAAGADLEAVLDLVARRGRALVAARAILVEVKEGTEMVVAAAAGGIPRSLIGRSVGAVPDLAVETRLVVPLSLRGRSYGALVALGSEFSIEDEETLEIFAAGAAAAVASARTFDLAGRRDQLAASESERARWARELQAIAGVEAETGRLRSLITELRPPVLDESGVGAAIEALADQVESPALEVQTWIELACEEGRVEAGHDEELKTAVYRIVQEALGNAVRHAHPSHVAIEVVDDGSGVRIAVRDDGRGFDPTAARGGFGLKRIRERVELVGGSLEIASAVDGGTEVRAAIPLSLRTTGLSRPFRV
ncbi:MAG TPA: ATP-binding protein [Solirubrobacterales bacterium]|nr:ATP-binding protein [Solirubrobacterales bacterium]